METTQTLEATTQPAVTDAPTPAPVPVETAGEASPDVAVAVEGVEVAVTDTKGGLELTPVTGLVGVLVLGLVAVVVARLRKK